MWSGGVSCSSSATIDALQKIAGRGYPPNFYEKIAVSLTDVRTRKSDDRSAVCAATMHVLPVLKSDLLKQSSLPPDQTAAQKKELEAEQVQDITYQVERTDDGKSVYVTPISFSN